MGKSSRISWKRINVIATYAATNPNSTLPSTLTLCSINSLTNSKCQPKQKGIWKLYEIKFWWSLGRICSIAKQTNNSLRTLRARDVWRKCPITNSTYATYVTNVTNE